MKEALKNTGLLFCWLMMACPMFAQSGVHFDESGMVSVMKRAKTEHRPVLYMFYATWCPHCNKVKAEVLTDPTVADYLTQNFICAAQDIDKGEGRDLIARFNIKSFPAFLFFDENETLLYSVNGELKTADMLTEAKNAKTPEKQLPYLKAQFYSDVKNADKCIAYLTTLRKGSDRKALSEPGHVYLATQSDEQLISPTNWRIIANAVTDINSREFQLVLKNQDKFAKVSSPVRVERKIMNIVSELLAPYTETLDTVGYKTQRATAKTINMTKTDSLIFSYDSMIAERTNNWGAYKAATAEGVEKFVWNDPKILKEIAQNYLTHVNDAASLKNAIKWVLRSLELKDSYDGNLLATRLYLKADDKKNAIIFARKAKALSTSMGWDPKEADALYKQLNIQ